MYCVIETQFYCDGRAESCATQFNALLGDLQILLKKHPGITCTAFDQDDWSIVPDELLEHPESEAELEIDDVSL